MNEELLSPDFPIPYITWPELLDDFHDHAMLELGHSTATPLQLPQNSENLGGVSRKGRGGHSELFFCMMKDLGGRLKPFVEHASDLVSKNETVIIVSRQSERLQDLWKESNLPTGDNPQFIESSLSEGFVVGDIHLITDSEIFGWERPQPRWRNNAKWLRRLSRCMPICRLEITSFTSITVWDDLLGWCNANWIAYPRIPGRRI